MIAFNKNNNKQKQRKEQYKYAVFTLFEILNS